MPVHKTVTLSTREIDYITLGLSHFVHFLETKQSAALNHPNPTERAKELLKIYEQQLAETEEIYTKLRDISGEY